MLPAPTSGSVVVVEVVVVPAVVELFGLLEDDSAFEAFRAAFAAAFCSALAALAAFSKLFELADLAPFSAVPKFAVLPEGISVDGTLKGWLTIASLEAVASSDSKVEGVVAG